MPKTATTPPPTPRGPLSSAPPAPGAVAAPAARLYFRTGLALSPEAVRGLVGPEAGAERSPRGEARDTDPRAFWPVTGQFAPPPSAGDKPYAQDGSLATLRLGGVMAFEGCGWWWCETLDTAAAARAVRAASADETVKTILLDWHSPGGQCYGLDDLVSAVRSAAKLKRVVSLAHDQCCSAAAWAAVQAGEFYATRTAQVGSLGVYTVVDDDSELLAKLGLKRFIVKVGEFKGAREPGIPVTPEVLDETLRQCQALYELLAADVAAGRKLAPARAAALCDGRIHDGAGAAALGLCDGVVVYHELVAALTAGGKPAIAKATAAPPTPATAPTDNVPRPAPAAARAGAARTTTAAAQGARAMTLDELKKDFPDLVKTIEDEAVKRHPDGEDDPADGGDTTARTRGRPPAAVATPGELKAAFPGEAEFVLECLERGDSVVAAKGHFCTVLAARNKDLKAQLDAAKTNPGKPRVEGTGTKPGVPPLALAGDRGEQPADGAGEKPTSAAFHALAKKLSQEKGLPIQRAMAMASGQRPDLHQAYLTDLRAGKVAAIA